jgi:uncharacterized protein (TIGR02246 family)
MLESPEAVAKAFEAAIADRDLQEALDLWLEDAVLVPPGAEPLRGRDAIRTVLAGLIDSGTRLAGETVGVYMAGDVALRAVRLRLTGRDPHGEPFETVSDGITVYALTESGWRIALDAPAGLARD